MLAPILEYCELRNIAGINTMSFISQRRSAGAAAAAAPSDTASTSCTFNRMVLLVHGFAGGLGNWARNWMALRTAADAEGADVHAIDLPGFGRSVREKVKFSDCASVVDYYARKIAEWLEALPEYRSGMQIDVVGHSFGAFIMAHIACRRPELFSTLVLADPWGVPPEVPDSTKSLPMRFRALLWLFYKTTPLGMMRALGPLGPSVMPKVRPDFAVRWSDFHGEDSHAFYDYTFLTNSLSPPTGELAFQACCVGTAFAKDPLLTLLPAKLDPKIRLVVMYGSQTWMDRGAGHEMVDQVKAARRGKPESAEVTMFTVPNAGHQLNTDNVERFDELLGEVLFPRAWM